MLLKTELPKGIGPPRTRRTLCARKTITHFNPRLFNPFYYVITVGVVGVGLTSRASTEEKKRNYLCALS